MFQIEEIFWRGAKFLNLTVAAFQLNCKFLHGSKIREKLDKGRVPRKKSGKGVIFCQIWGRGGSRRVVKSQTSILEKYF